MKYYYGEDAEGNFDLARKLSEVSVTSRYRKIASQGTMDTVNPFAC